MKKLREFPEWPFEQVEEVARMLYATAPFGRESWNNRVLWTSLARQACDFLDHLHNACGEVTRQRRTKHTSYRRDEERIAKAKTLPGVVPFEKAARIITNQKRTERARMNLKTLVLKNPRYFGGLFGKPPTVQAVNGLIKRWRKTGIPRRDVMELQNLFEGSWPHIIAEQNREKAGKRKPRLNVKDKPVIREVLREIQSD